MSGSHPRSVGFATLQLEAQRIGLPTIRPNPLSLPSLSAANRRGIHPELEGPLQEAPKHTAALLRRVQPDPSLLLIAHLITSLLASWSVETCRATCMTAVQCQCAPKLSGSVPFFYPSGYLPDNGPSIVGEAIVQALISL